MIWKTTEYAGWGQALKATGEVARPERQSDLLSLPPAPAFGLRRSYGDSALNSAGRVIDMTRLDRLISFDPATGLLEAEGGVRIGDLAARFAPLGWLPAVMPGTGFATIGGCIAQDVHGKNHHNAGSFCQHVTRMTLLQRGELVEVTPGTPAFRATAGGLGQTGVIVSAVVQMVPVKGAAMMVTERRAENWDEHLAYLDASTATHTVGWIDGTARGDSLGRGIVEEAESSSGLVKSHVPVATVPMNAPHFALSKPIVRAFNEVYYRRVPARGRTSVKPVGAFFFPLDKILEWNRLYGRRGFHQFQCVVPLSSAPALRAMLEEIANSGLCSPLAVLKRMGPGRGGYLSFPMEGYTLAIDFPNRDAARALIKRLEGRTAEAGGRLYFAKDSLAEGVAMRAMYPELPEWREEVRRTDPDGHLITDLVRRLGLRSAA